ncbi:MAG TPA: biotin synthase BioB [Planctomycetota bacterium]|nr:biotin synthase BioB [Planctomycetota bacterium]
MDWGKLSEQVLEGGALSRDEALSILRAPDSETFRIVDAAARIRRHHHGNRVKIHVLCNAKSGLCPEDCGFCSQSSVSRAPIGRYRMLDADAIGRAAENARRAHAWKFCVVLASRGPSDHEMDVVCDAVKRIKRDVRVNVCTSLGILNAGQAVRLKQSGVDRFNHNLETSSRHFPKICSTHDYDDRVETIRHCKAAGLGTCCGGIAGMGETDEDLVDLAFALRDLDVDSIPVNFLNPVPGTPMEAQRNLNPLRCLRILALVRFANPSKDIRAAGGREVSLGEHQAAALRVANSIFTEGYLTTPGNTFRQDLAMIRDAGMEIVEP